jgi:hypothetical protein
MREKVIRFVLVLGALGLGLAAQSPTPIAALAACSCEYCETHALGFCIYGGSSIRCSTYYAEHCVDTN